MHKHKVLIVEDNKFNHDLFRDVFEQAGFEVSILEHADGDFLDRVAEISPDIISMDIMIGIEGREAERDGLMAIEALKADLRTAEIPIIVLTNFYEEGKVFRARDGGAVDYINLASHAIQKVPFMFEAYLDNPKKYKASHPSFRRAT